MESNQLYYFNHDKSEIMQNEFIQLKEELIPFNLFSLTDESRQLTQNLKNFENYKIWGQRAWEREKASTLTGSMTNREVYKTGAGYDLKVSKY